MKFLCIITCFNACFVSKTLRQRLIPCLEGYLKGLRFIAGYGVYCDNEAPQTGVYKKWLNNTLANNTIE